MIIDSHIVTDYLSGKNMERYKDYWIYNAFEESSIFEIPDPKNKVWISKFYEKICDQIMHFVPRNK